MSKPYPIVVLATLKPATKWQKQVMEDQLEVMLEKFKNNCENNHKKNDIDWIWDWEE